MTVLALIAHHVDDFAIDTAISSALLRQVSAGEIGPTLRLFVPGRVVAFGAQDRTRSGYRHAVERVQDLGYAAIERLAGGKAAVFHEGTIAFAWSTPEVEPKIGIELRYQQITTIVMGALNRLGIEGAVGEVAGEYCPGRFSVSSDNRKVMGVGQRLVRGAAHVGGVVSVHSPDLINSPLLAAYDALGYDWDPATTGSLGIAVDDAMAALEAAFADAGHELQSAELASSTLELARSMSAEHGPQIP
jgi:octanoyl-[GcvH]:protein N-octanoyltransferase